MKKCGGGYIDVPYLQDAVLVNLGALMQNWTSDRYMATVSLLEMPCLVFYITLPVPVLYSSMYM